VTFQINCVFVACIVSGLGSGKLSCGNWFTQPEMRPSQEVVMAMCLQWQHALYAPLGVEA